MLHSNLKPYAGNLSPNDNVMQVVGLVNYDAPTFKLSLHRPNGEEIEFNPFVSGSGVMQCVTLRLLVGVLLPPSSSSSASTGGNGKPIDCLVK